MKASRTCIREHSRFRSMKPMQPCTDSSMNIRVEFILVAPFRLSTYSPVDLLLPQRIFCFCLFHPLCSTTIERFSMCDFGKSRWIFHGPDLNGLFSRICARPSALHRICVFLDYTYRKEISILESFFSFLKTRKIFFSRGRMIMNFRVISSNR